MIKQGLERKEEKSAFLFMMLTFIILFFVAVFPLSYVFYTSFTNKGFATAKETSFVGIKNYSRLLSLTIKELPPVMTRGSVLEKPEQMVNPETGELVYEKAVNVLPKELIRYKELAEFNLFGKKYVIGATDPYFIKAIGITLQFVFFSVFIETILGFAIALVVNSNFKGRGVMRAVMLVPWAMVGVVTAKLWNWMMHPSRVGLFNTIIDKFGVGGGNISFLSEKGLAIPSLIIIDVWKNTPFVALLLLAGLQVIPQQLYEAAAIDGAGSVRQFIHITLPQLKTILAVALIFRTLDALRVFDLFNILLGDSVYSMSTYNYFQLTAKRDMGYSSAVGVVIFILLFGFAIIYIKALGVRSNE